MLLGYLARNKVFLVLVIIAAGIFFLSAKINSEKPPTFELATYQVIAPAYELAPKVVATASRIYYVRTFEETANTLALLTWYDYNETQWQKHTTPLPLDKSNIKIYSRRQVK